MHEFYHPVNNNHSTITTDNNYTRYRLLCVVTIINSVNYTLIKSIVKSIASAIDGNTYACNNDNLSSKINT